MILEARAADCFSSSYVLKVNDRAIGKFESQWFSESLSIQLMERRHLEFRKISWLGSQFDLVDVDDEEVLGQCDRTGLFTSAWDLYTSVGQGQLVKPSWFGTAYEFFLGDVPLAMVERIGWCERGWRVDGGGDLTTEDLLLIGLVFHVIQHRQQQQHHAGGHGS